MEEKLTAVLYTDGSFISNGQGITEGFYGSGCHGYIFDQEKINKTTGDRPSKYNITESGYFPTDSISTLTEEQRVGIQNVAPKYYFDCCYSFLNKGTNNSAELRGVIESLRDLKDTKIELSKILLKIDSEYTITMIQKILTLGKESWFIPDMPNVTHLLDLEQILLAYKNEGVEITTSKVKGHSIDLGNNIADRLSYFARVQSSHREIKRIFKLVDTSKEKYWNIDDGRTPLLKFKQLFFTNTLRADQTEIIYSLMEYPTDVTPGTKSSDCCFGLVIPEQVVPQIEDAIKRYHKLGWKTNTFNIISTLNLNNLYSRNNIHYYNLLGDDVYRYNHKQDCLMNIEQVPIIYTVRPSGLAVQAMNNMEKLHNIVTFYRRRNEGVSDSIDFIDILPKLYSSKTKKKDVEVKTCEIANGTNSIQLNIDSKFKKGMVINLDLGKDTLTRNQFKQLEKSIKSVTLALHRVSENVIAYYTIIEADGHGLGIYCNLYSGVYLM